MLKLHRFRHTNTGIEFATEIAIKGNLLAFPSIRKCPRDGRGKSAFPLSMIRVFKTKYFWKSMPPPPKISQPLHPVLICLKIRRKTGSISVSNGASSLKLSKNYSAPLWFSLTHYLWNVILPLMCDSTAVHSWPGFDKSLWFMTCHDIHDSLLSWSNT